MSEQERNCNTCASKETCLKNLSNIYSDIYDICKPKLVDVTKLPFEREFAKSFANEARELLLATYENYRDREFAKRCEYYKEAEDKSNEQPKITQGMAKPV